MSILKLHSEPVQESWLDFYGHLNEGYYVVAFSNATWAVQEHFGVNGTDYFQQTGCALYTVETHLRYLNDVRAPAMLDFESMIVGSDAKKVHLAHVMTVDGVERATFECLLLHFDTKAGRTTPMPETTQAMLRAATLTDTPEWSGRSVSIAKK